MSELDELNDFDLGMAPRMSRPGRRKRTEPARRQCAHLDGDGNECRHRALDHSDKCLDHLDAERFDGEFL